MEVNMSKASAIDAGAATRTNASAATSTNTLLAANKGNNRKLTPKVLIFLVASLSLLISSSITSSFTIGIAFALISTAAAQQFLHQYEERRKDQLSQIWPEVIDHLFSGLYSGLSISEALSDLAIRGPEITRADFANFNSDMRNGVDFAVGIANLRQKFAHHGSDQIFEALSLARTLGGGELLNTLRTLGSFQREDLALNKEIAIKRGWIKNSAHISSAAPWVLLLMLGSQSGTAKAFTSPTGMFILLTGVVLTLIAYLWMGQISKLPQTPRVFKGSEAN